MNDIQNLEQAYEVATQADQQLKAVLRFLAGQEIGKVQKLAIIEKNDASIGRLARVHEIKGYAEAGEKTLGLITHYLGWYRSWYSEEE